VLPPVLVSVASKNLSKALERRVTIQEIKVNPYTLVVTVKGLSISDLDRHRTFASFDSLMVNAEWASLFKRAPVVREVRLHRPSVRIVRFEDNTYNVSDLLHKDAKKGKSAPMLFSVSNIQVTGGTVIMDDRPVHKIHTAEDISLSIPFISNMPHLTEVFVQPAFHAVINKTPITLTGRSKPFSESLESTLSLDLKDIDIPRYLAYVPAKFGFALESCRADLSATITFRQFKDKRTPESSVSGRMVLSDVVLAELDGIRLLSIPSLTVDVAASSFLSKEVHVRKIGVHAPVLALRRDRSGTLNLSWALKQTKATGKPPEQPKETPPPEPVLLTIDEISLEKGALSYLDSSGGSPVKIVAADLTARAYDITTSGNGGGKVVVSCTINDTGRLTLDSSFTLKPFTADTAISMDDLQPAWVQPYVMERVPILIRRGTLSARGRVRLARDGDRPLGLHFTGDVRINDFASVDRAHAEDLLSWKDLSITGIDLTLNPGRLAIAEIELAGASGAFIVNPDGSSNVPTLAGEKKATLKHAEGGRKKAMERVAVGRVRVKNGRFTFTDRTVTPKYTSSLTAINGTVTGLSSDEFRKAVVNLQARLDNQAPIAITGSINPLKKDLFVDLKATLKNMELSPVTPYSGTYAGLAIEKGKLSLDLDYLIDRKRLNAKNDVIIDQLTFGEAVPSEKATRLPVRLAVALLRDSSGRIDLHLPVTGRTDDPEFHIGRLVLKMIVNILEKAATSPFALLEAMYPGATELSHITFEPGRSTLTDDARKKLSDLAKILTEKPSLTLEITGFVDASSDREGLAKTLFERKLKAQKIKDLLKAGKQASSVDEISLEPAEYGTYLAKAYRAESFDKPTNVLGIPKTLPDEEMKLLIMEHIKVTDDDLKALAAARSRQVRDELAHAWQVDPGRIFLVEADPFKPEQIDKVANSRVSLTIK
ncbi:MAG TPA: DUF748 domain-containing protein, partial [Deltaproteobacteria bacterium]|nr:DUF748 domain-containing protein [Deltaproteobacteria bacterium]